MYSMQWRRKIVEFRGAEARRHAALPCFSLVWRSQTLAHAGRVWNQAYIRICSRVWLRQTSFSPANIELFITTNSPEILCYSLGCTQIHFHQTQTNYQLLHFFQSYTCLLVWLVKNKNDATVPFTCDQITEITALTAELRYSKYYARLTLFEAYFHIITWKSRFDLSRSKLKRLRGVHP